MKRSYGCGYYKCKREAVHRFRGWSCCEHVPELWSLWLSQLHRKPVRHNEYKWKLRPRYTQEWGQGVDQYDGAPPHAP